VTKFRDRESRKTRLEKLDEDVVYDAGQLDRDVVAVDQIRTVIRTFKQNLFKPVEEGGIFPGRTEVPKTLIFAKDDSHADDIVRICREEFGRGNDFAVKITYRTTGVKPEDLLNQFRNSFNPRIAVTVDMIATGTDVRPLECVMFMRNVRSRNFFEQMKGRGVRIIDSNDLQAVSADAPAKTHFVIVDAVGVTEAEFNDTQPLERRKSETLKKMLDQIAAGVRDPDVLSSIAGRLARLDRVITAEDRAELADAGGGVDLTDLVRTLTRAVDIDVAWERAASASGGEDPTEDQVADARAELLEQASRVLAERPALREKLIEVRRSYTEVLDETSKDQVIDASFSRDATDRARQTVESWEAFVVAHKDDITRYRSCTPGPTASASHCARSRSSPPPSAGPRTTGRLSGCGQPTKRLTPGACMDLPEPCSRTLCHSSATPSSSTKSSSPTRSLLSTDSRAGSLSRRRRARTSRMSSLRGSLASKITSPHRSPSHPTISSSNPSSAMAATAVPTQCSMGGSPRSLSSSPRNSSRDCASDWVGVGDTWADRQVVERRDTEIRNAGLLRR
jgi:superfamily II DNA or RNA helicase